MVKNDLKVGAILASTWGYSCERHSFYKVTKVSDTFVTLQKIGKKYTSGDGNSVMAYVVPADTESSEKSFRRKIKEFRDGSCGIDISNYEWCINIHSEGKTYFECCD